MHTNYMQYYWQVVLITEDGTFTVGDGWASCVQFALEDAEEWIHKAENLLPADYKAEVHKAKTGVDDLECDHEETEPYLKCKKCGKWLHG